jgi:hypothetical protein
MGLYLCFCGKEFITRVRSVKTGKAKSCGCLQRKVASQPKNEYKEGDKLGELTFIRRVISNPTEPKAKFLCQCGNEFITRIQSAKDGITKSCGCMSRKFVIEARTIHAPVEYLENGVKKIPSLRPEDIHRFWGKVQLMANPFKCWEWQATGDRYGGFRVGKSMYKSSRVAYFLHYNEQPGELEVMHSCDNPKCCNPNHLSLGTHLENMQDMADKGRAKKEFKLI